LLRSPSSRRLDGLPPVEQPVEDAEKHKRCDGSHRRRAAPAKRFEPSQIKRPPFYVVVRLSTLKDGPLVEALQALRPKPGGLKWAASAVADLAFRATDQSRRTSGVTFGSVVHKYICANRLTEGGDSYRFAQRLPLGGRARPARREPPLLPAGLQTARLALTCTESAG
jgi:hypothetical protein